ncbi:cytochrome c-type biogenesis protein CcmH [Thiogranum longum]|uniref:Cytochrome c-type biogenesis protein n=1 Tax=Thiogranum longum TaxID=1537524 RepID=A0A4R1H9N2_9GAMM|nr:cytochrome c-type biogenesis protein [Thiogranum longum]TCK18607.1 cytochrome c-type biogenesis protein CcmH [Thiogranum longum]
MKSFRLYGVLIACMAISSALFSPLQAAGLEAFDFSGNVDETRFKSLIAELRCLVCQNQSLADSDADLAHDLRREVYELMDQGKSNQEIVDYLVARYGDFVLYNPPVKPETWILWYGPFGLLAVGFFILLYTVRQRKRQPEADFSEQEKERLKQLLGDDNNNGDKPA